MSTLWYLWSESCVLSVQYKDVLKLGICTSSYLGLISQVDFTSNFFAGNFLAGGPKMSHQQYFCW